MSFIEEYTRVCTDVTAELERTLKSIDPDQVQRLKEEILKADHLRGKRLRRQKRLKTSLLTRRCPLRTRFRKEKYLNRKEIREGKYHHGRKLRKRIHPHRTGLPEAQPR